jgi:hypothetical protein
VTRMLWCVRRSSPLSPWTVVPHAHQRGWCWPADTRSGCHRRRQRWSDNRGHAVLARTCRVRRCRSVAIFGRVRDPDRAADILWAIGSPETYQQLTIDRGWSDDDYRNWLTTTIQAVLLR